MGRNKKEALGKVLLVLGEEENSSNIFTLLTFCCSYLGTRSIRKGFRFPLYVFIQTESDCDHRLTRTSCLIHPSFLISKNVF